MNSRAVGEDVVNALAEAAKRGSWADVGRLLDRLEGGDPGSGHWLSVAVEKTGQNRDMLRKMQRASRFVDSQEGSVKELLASSPLSHVDVVVRAIGLDAEAGNGLLGDYLADANRFTYRDLLSRYESLRRKAVGLSEGKVKRTKAAASEFHRVCLAIAEGRQMLALYWQVCDVGPETIGVRVWKGGHPLVSPYATIRRPEGSRVGGDRAQQIGVDGVDCHMSYKTDAPEVARRRMLMAATEATLFDLFWVFVPEEQAEAYERLAGELEVPNLGLLRVNLAKGVVAKTRLPYGGPVPDRRRKWDAWTLRYVASVALPRSG